MKKIFLPLLFTLFFMSGTKIYAYDIVHEGLCYNVISFADKTVELVDVEEELSEELNVPLTISFNNVDFDVISIGKKAFYNCRFKKILLSNTISDIKPKAFQRCINLESFDWPESVEVMNYGMFYECNNLKTINLPSTLKGIKGNNQFGFSGVDEKGAFENCTSLENITLPESLIELGGACFAHCESLKSINLPKDITYIGPGTFFCTIIEEIEIPANVTWIGNSAFSGCRNLKNIVIPEDSKIESIGYYAFLQTAITHIDLPKNLKEIGKLWSDQEVHIFPETLVSITLPNNYTTILNGNYRNLKLEKIYSRNPNPQEISVDNFNMNSIMLGTLFVPVGTIELYKTTNGWKEFYNIQEYGTNNIEKVVSNQNLDNASYYSPIGISIIDKYHGINIIKMSDGTTKKIIVK